MQTFRTFVKISSKILNNKCKPKALNSKLNLPYWAGDAEQNDQDA